MVFKRSDWNALIQRVNNILENPPSGCEAVEPLEEVGPKHRWSKADIRAVQDRLKATCPDITFGDIPDKWQQSTLDEIEAAIAQAWCNCDECVYGDPVGYEGNYALIFGFEDFNITEWAEIEPDPNGGWWMCLYEESYTQIPDPDPEYEGAMIDVPKPSVALVSRNGTDFWGVITPSGVMVCNAGGDATPDPERNPIVFSWCDYGATDFMDALIRLLTKIWL